MQDIRAFPRREAFGGGVVVRTERVYLQIARRHVRAALTSISTDSCSGLVRAYGSQPADPDPDSAGRDRRGCLHVHAQPSGPYRPRNDSATSKQGHDAIRWTASVVRHVRARGNRIRPDHADMAGLSNSSLKTSEHSRHIRSAHRHYRPESYGLCVSVWQRTRMCTLPETPITASCS